MRDRVGVGSFVKKGVILYHITVVVAFVDLLRVYFHVLFDVGFASGGTISTL